jgi:hypothetical protein
VGIAALERTGVKALWAFLCIACGSVAVAGSSVGESTNDVSTVIVVVGAPGEQEYAEVFNNAAKLWNDACRAAGARYINIGLHEPGSTNDLARLKGVLADEPRETARELWLVLIGHGTFDGKEAKFNLRGPDLSATELADALQPFHRPLAVIDTSSASAPFLNKLSAPGRVIITATRSGYEQNYTRFPQFFSAAISNPEADLDKDGQVSLLEAFLLAAHNVADFYKGEGRLATEHPLLDDNGDGLGTPPDWFRGIRAVKKAADASALDGLHAHQWHLIPCAAERKLSPTVRLRRNQIEEEVEQLRESKDTLPVDEYYQRLEVLLLDLSRLYESSENKSD